MSQIRFAAAAALILFIVAPSIAQDCGCEPRPAIPQCPTQGCQTGCCGRKCIPADQLWANFGNEISCKGCVRCQKVQPYLPGLCGHPACNLNGCSVDKKNCIGLPSTSIYWPRPLHLPNVACNSLAPKVTDVFNVFGLGKQKKVRCDIPNDCFGKLGDSKACDSTYFKPLPPVPAAENSVQPTPYSRDITPAPMVEPVAPIDNNSAPAMGQPNDSAMLPPVGLPRLNESAQNVQYGRHYRAKR